MFFALQVRDSSLAAAILGLDCPELLASRASLLALFSFASVLSWMGHIRSKQVLVGRGAFGERLALGREKMRTPAAPWSAVTLPCLLCLGRHSFARHGGPGHLTAACAPAAACQGHRGLRVSRPILRQPGLLASSCALVAKHRAAVRRWWVARSGYGEATASMTLRTVSRGHTPGNARTNERR